MPARSADEREIAVGAADRKMLDRGPDARATTADGRRLRGLRNRHAVVEAMLSLLEDGVTSPSAAEIAERAGVSLRSVFRHFDDLDALFLAGIERQTQKTSHLYKPPSPNGTATDRVQALVRQRRRLHEAVAPVRRGWVLRFRDHPTMVPVMAEVRSELRRQISELFAADLADLSPSVRREVVDAIDLATSFPAWDYLRFDQELSVNRAAGVMRRTVLAVLKAAGVAVGDA